MKTRTGSQLLRAVRQNLKEQRTFTLSLEKENFREAKRISRAWAPYQRRLLKGALSAAGIEADEITRHRKAESAKLATVLARQKRAILQRARIITQQNSDKAEAMRIHVGLVADAVAHPLPEKAFILSNAEIDVKGTPQGGPKQAQVNVQFPGGKNAVKIRVKLVSTEYDHIVSATVFADFHFIWISDRDGFVNVRAPLLSNGSLQMILEPQLPSFRGNAGTTLNSTFAVSQFGPNNTTLSTLRNEDLNTSVNSPSLFSGSIIGGTCCPYSNQSWLPLNDIVVSKGDPVLVTVGFEIRCLLHATGQLDLDFATGDFQISVPWALLFAF